MSTPDITPADTADVRTEVADWLAANWQPEDDLVAFRTRALDAGWLVPTWSPDEFGRGLSAAAAEPIAPSSRRSALRAAPT